MNKNKQISELLLKKIESGMSIEEAIDSVFGEGSYKKLAYEVYDLLRNKSKGLKNE